MTAGILPHGPRLQDCPQPFVGRPMTARVMAEMRAQLEEHLKVWLGAIRLSDITPFLEPTGSAQGATEGDTMDYVLTGDGLERALNVLRDRVFNVWYASGTPPQWHEAFVSQLPNRRSRFLNGDGIKLSSPKGTWTTPPSTFHDPWPAIRRTVGVLYEQLGTQEAHGE